MRAPPDRGLAAPLRWFAVIAGLLLVGGLITGGAILLLDDDEADVVASPTARSDVALLAEADVEARTVGTLSAGEPVRLVGRTADGAWLLVESESEDAVAGWLPVSAVRDAGALDALAVVESGADDPAPTAEPTAEPTVAGEATTTPDQPDLVVLDALSRDNLLVVAIANEGAADIDGPIEVRVNEGAPHRVDVGGKPLRPGDVLEAPIEGEYVQLRAQIVVSVSGPPGLEEADTENNTDTFVVEPDLPNDIEILDVDPGDGAQPLTVTVRNNSPIPVVGRVTIAVRETGASVRLLARIEGMLDLEPQATREYEVPEVVGADITRIQALLSTDGIADASAANNVYPR